MVRPFPTLAAGCLGICLALATNSAACPDRAADSSRIAVAGGSITEILYFLGAAGRVVAVDTTSTYPEEAAIHPNLGYVRNLSAEGMLSTKPTLIMGEDDMGPPQVIKQVAATGVDIARIPEETTALGILKKVRCIAQVVGLEKRAEEAIETRLQSAIEELASLRSIGRHSTFAFLLVMREGSATAAGAETSAHGFIEMIGGVNVFSGISGWKPVSVEAILQADPDFIVMTERGLRGLGGFEEAKKPTVLGMSRAMQGDRLIIIDGMAALGFGPRTLLTAVRTRKEILASL